jgi:hypothetical protein
MPGETHTHGFQIGDWPFEDSQYVGAVTTVHVLEGRLPVLLVTHDEDDGGWQILCGTTNEPADGRMACLGCMVQQDPSLQALADLPVGWMAWRESATAPWQRKPSGPDVN